MRVTTSLNQKLIAIALVIGALAVGAANAAQAAQPAWILGYPCASEMSCHQGAMYKPSRFQLGSHYWFTNVKWLSWNPYTASAMVTLHAEFPGARPVAHRTVVIFGAVRTLCGVRSYTTWISGDGNAQIEQKVAGSGCMWALGSP